MYWLVNVIGAGKAPVFKSRANSEASLNVKLPLITACPPAMASFTLGAKLHNLDLDEFLDDLNDYVYE